jgi:hypothetical protein
MNEVVMMRRDDWTDSKWRNWTKLTKDTSRSFELTSSDQTNPHEKWIIEWWSEQIKREINIKLIGRRTKLLMNEVVMMAIRRDDQSESKWPNWSDELIGLQLTEKRQDSIWPWKRRERGQIWSCAHWLLVIKLNWADLREWSWRVNVNPKSTVDREWEKCAVSERRIAKEDKEKD